MDWKNIGQSFLNAGLPLIGTLLGGPLGGIAGKTIGALISSKLGIKEEDLTPEKYTEILGDPDMVAKLKQLELDHEVELEKLVIEDRKSARERELGIVKATGTRDINLYILAYLFIFGFFTTTIAMSWLLIVGKVPENMPEGAIMLLGMLFGTLTAGVGAVMQYFFGSSKGSSDKTKLMALPGK